MTTSPLTSVVASVQRNCDISDARHAGDSTMCIYLLRMREYFRWQQRIALGDALPAEHLGAWIGEREAYLEEIEGEDFARYDLKGFSFDPFDQAALNRALAPEGLVYSSGLGRFGKPVFFLGELERAEQLEGYDIFVSGEELARELAAPPAAARDRTIIVRRESLRRLIWEHVEEWRFKKPGNAMSRVVRCYDFEHNGTAALDAMTDCEIESLILHEIGELVAGELLGEDWEEMLQAVSRSSAEIMVRAVRDHLADCLTALPGLISSGPEASLHFYFANMTPMRRELFPALERAYGSWSNGGGIAGLKETVKRGRDHWLGLAQRIMKVHRDHGEGAAGQIEALVPKFQL